MRGAAGEFSWSVTSQIYDVRKFCQVKTLLLIELLYSDFSSPPILKKGEIWGSRFLGLKFLVQPGFPWFLELDLRKVVIMLVLTRKVGERIQIGDQITLSVIRVQNGKVRIGIEAPDDVRVRRDELESDTRNCMLSDRSQNAVDAATTATTRIFLTC